MSCPSCFRGSTTNTLPSGTESDLYNLPTYFAEPPASTPPKGIIVIIPDAFGWTFPNNRIVADRYASHGYLVYIPDFMNGYNLNAKNTLDLTDKIYTPQPSRSWLTYLTHQPINYMQMLFTTNLLPWSLNLLRHPANAQIISFFRSLRSSSAPEVKIGAAGFCWGGSHVLKTLAPSSEHLIDCAFAAHPAPIQIPTDILALKNGVPTSIAVGTKDEHMPMPKPEEVKKLIDGMGEEGRFECVVYEGCRHGFAVRSHPDDLVEVEAAERAEEQALRWFGRWLV